MSKEELHMNLNFGKKLSIPIIILLIVSLSILGFILYSQTKADVEDQLILQSQNQLDTIEYMFKNQTDLGVSIKNEIGKSYVSSAHAVADLIQNDPRVLSTEGLTRLATDLGLDEVHVTDENGVLISGTDPDSYGFDFNDSEQTKPFVDLINSSEDSLVQPPQLRGKDDKMYQYIGVKRKDSPGIIQVGINPETTAYIEDLLDINKYIDNIKIGSDGYPFVLDSQGKALMHPNSEVQGTVIKEDFIKEMLDKKEGSIKYTFQGVDKISAFTTFDGITLAVTQSVDIIESMKKEFLKTLLLVGFIVILLSIAFIYLIVKKFATQPLNKVVTAIEQVQNGDLNVQIDNNSNDEFGHLASSFNIMTSNIKQLVSNIIDLAGKLDLSLSNMNENARGIGIASEEVARTVHEIAEGSNVQAMDTSQALELTNVLSASVGSITDNLKSVMEGSDNMRVQNEHGGRTIVELKDKLRENEEAFNEVSKSIVDLSQKSSLIGSILEAIESISEQINLLSLNAAIEAARAGEHGYGFAVVADEIRTLSEDTNRSTSEIQNIIKEIQEVVEDTTKNSDIAKQSVENANETLHDTEEVTIALGQAVKVAIGQIESLSTAVEGINDIKDKTLMSIENISALTEESAASTEEISASAEEQTASIEEVVSTIESLNEMSSDLEELVRQFKI